MLNEIENLSEKTALSLNGFFPKRLSERLAVFSLLDWKSCDGAWVQTEGESVTALIVQKESSKVYAAAREDADLYELADFIAGLGGMVVHCPSDITERLGVTAFSKLSLMSLSSGDKSVSGAYRTVDLSDNPRAAFDLITAERLKILKNGASAGEMKKYTEKAYKQWLAGINKGLNSGVTSVTGVAAGKNSVLCACVADRLCDTAYIREFAFDSEFRGMGYAADCVKAVCKRLLERNESVFTACSDLKTEAFYREAGFEREDYIDLGIVEI